MLLRIFIIGVIWLGCSSCADAQCVGGQCGFRSARPMISRSYVFPTRSYVTVPQASYSTSITYPSAPVYSYVYPYVSNVQSVPEVKQETAPIPEVSTNVTRHYKFL